jgi:hypothetical protein
VTAILTASESTALAEHEAVIERGIQTFYEVGMALADIRDRKLYRADHRTFEEYCQGRWQMTGSRAYQMIDAANVVSTIVETELPPPANEGQARELGRVPAPERAEVWRETVERTDGKPTAAAVRETYEQRQNPPSDEDLLGGAEFVVHDDTPAAPLEPPKPKRPPLDKTFMSARVDLERAANRLGSIANDDRFQRNRQMVHGQMTELMIAVEQVAELVEAADLPSQEDERLRHWWAERLNTIGNALTGIANNLN